MIRKSGLNDVILFDFVANNICDYFLYGSTSPNKKDSSNKDIAINVKNNHISNNNGGRIEGNEEN